jgi:hypothetical protein
VPDKPNPITMDRYEHLLNELLRAELAVTETQTEFFLRTAERIAARSRRAPKPNTRRRARPPEFQL